jgi:hypothetical protein
VKIEGSEGSLPDRHIMSRVALVEDGDDLGRVSSVPSIIRPLYSLT